MMNGSLPVSVQLEIETMMDPYLCSFPSNDFLTEAMRRALDDMDLEQFLGILRYNNQDSVREILMTEEGAMSFKRIVTTPVSSLPNTEIIHKTMLFAHAMDNTQLYQKTSINVFTLIKQLPSTLFAPNNLQLSQKLSRVFQIPFQTKEVLGLSDIWDETVECLFYGLVSSNQFRKATSKTPSFIFQTRLEIEFQGLEKGMRDELMLFVLETTFVLECRRVEKQRFFNSRDKEENKEPKAVCFDPKYYEKVKNLLSSNNIPHASVFRIYSLLETVWMLLNRKRVESKYFPHLSLAMMSMGRNPAAGRFIESIRDRDLKESDKRVFDKVVEGILCNSQMVYENMGNYVKIVDLNPDSTQLCVVEEFSLFSLFHCYEEMEIGCLVILCCDFPDYDEKVINAFLPSKIRSNNINPLISKYSFLVSTFLFNQMTVRTNPKLPFLLFRIMFLLITRIVKNQLEVSPKNLMRMVRVSNQMIRFSERRGYFCVTCLEGVGDYVCRVCKRVCRLVKRLQVDPSDLGGFSQVANYITDFRMNLSNLQPESLIISLLQIPPMTQSE